MTMIENNGGRSVPGADSGFPRLTSDPTDWKTEILGLMDYCRQLRSDTVGLRTRLQTAEYRIANLQDTLRYTRLSLVILTTVVLAVVIYLALNWPR